MATEKTAVKLGAVRKCAAGGFIGSLFGSSKPETMTEKFARQDAEFKAKHPQQAQPAAAQAPSTTPTNAISGYAGMNAMRAREKAAGLKVGGMVRKKCVEGGEISGPGGPTDDLVPIDASNGEFMIKASSAKILGPEVLEALNDLGDEPKDPKMDAAEDAREEGMKCGGAVRKKMADGGPVEMPMNTTPMTEQDQQAFGALQNTATGVAPAIPAPTTTAQAAQQPPKQLRASTTAALNSYTPLPIPQLKAGGMVRGKPVLKMAAGGPVEEDRQKRIAQIPAGGTAPAPDGLSQGTDFTRNANNSLNALGGMGVVASVPLKAAQAGQGAIRTAMNAAPVLTNSIPRLAAPVAKAAQAAPDFVAGASGVQRVGGANLPAVVQNAGIPISKTTNVALQEGAKANQMAAGTRSLGNASAGAGMLDQQQAPLEQVPPVAPSAPSLNAPWYSPEYAKAANMSDLNGLELERARRAAGSPGDANDPLKSLILNGTVGASSPATAQAKPATAATSTQPTLPANTRGQGYTDPRQAGVSQPSAAPTDEFSNAAIAQRNPGGMVRKVVGADGRTTYSGSNISGDVSFQGADGNALPGRPGGGFMSYGGMSQEQIKSALTNPDGSAWSAGDNAIMAANIRDGVDKYRGTSRDPRNDPMNQPMTKDQRAARVRMAEVASQDKRYAQTDAREQAQLGMNRAEHVSKMAKEKQATDLQNAYMNAKTPEEKESYRQKMVALGLLKGQEDEYAYAPGGQVVIDNQLVTQPGVIFNKRTGKQQGGPQGAQAQQQGSSSVAAPTSQAEYDKLPKGARYTHPDGTTRTKG